MDTSCTRYPEKVQANVIKAIETMTGLAVDKVNISVLGIHFVKEAPAGDIPQE